MLLQQGMAVPVMVGALAAAFAVLFHILCALRSGRISKGLFVHGSVETLDRLSVALVGSPDIERCILAVPTYSYRWFR